jgi:putative oligomerization/nucleic acid binding protein
MKVGPTGLRVLRVAAILVLAAGVILFAVGLYETVTLGCYQYVPGQTVCQGNDTSNAMEFGGVGVFLLGLFATLGLTVGLAGRRRSGSSGPVQRPSDASLPARLEELAGMHERGLLTDDQFERAKNKLIG